MKICNQTDKEIELVVGTRLNKEPEFTVILASGLFYLVDKEFFDIVVIREP